MTATNSIVANAMASARNAGPVIGKKDFGDAEVTLVDAGGRTSALVRFGVSSNFVAAPFAGAKKEYDRLMRILGNVAKALEYARQMDGKPVQ